MTYYLKVNREEYYTYRNLQFWFDALTLIPDINVYILCDKETLKQNIIKNVDFKNIPVAFIESYHTKIHSFVNSITQDCWKNAGCAHLTTFMHAAENGFKAFWNIDADDTCFCLSPQRMTELLSTTENYASTNNIHIFSLDMHRSALEGQHWSFGVTYTDNSIDWFNIIQQYSKDSAYKKMCVILADECKMNVDWFFTYLKKVAPIRIETFYFENLKFIHYSNDFFKRPLNSGMYHWSNGQLLFPILYYCIGDHTKGMLPIYDDIIKLDINIQDSESIDFLKSTSKEKDLLLCPSRNIETKLCERLKQINAL